MDLSYFEGNPAISPLVSVPTACVWTRMVAQGCSLTPESNSIVLRMIRDRKSNKIDGNPLGNLVDPTLPGPHSRSRDYYVITIWIVSVRIFSNFSKPNIGLHSDDGVKSNSVCRDFTMGPFVQVFSV